MTLAQGLALESGDDVFIIFRDLITNQEYIRRSRELHNDGLYVEMDAYRFHVFTDFRHVHDGPDHLFSRLHDEIQGAGVDSIQKKFREMSLAPLHQSFEKLIHSPPFVAFLNRYKIITDDQFRPESNADVILSVRHFINIIREYASDIIFDVDLSQIVLNRLDSAVDNAHLTGLAARTGEMVWFDVEQLEFRHNWRWFFIILFTEIAGLSPRGASHHGGTIFEEYLLEGMIREWLSSYELDSAMITDELCLLRALLSFPPDYLFGTHGPGSDFDVLEELFKDKDVRSFLRVNKHKDSYWFNKEQFHSFLSALAVSTVLQISGSPPAWGRDPVEKIINRLNRFAVEAELSGYSLNRVMAIFRTGSS